MDGVAGYSFWRNTILVYINPVDGWDTALRSTICHEFAHAVAQNYNKMETILDQLVFDGGDGVHGEQAVCFYRKRDREILIPVTSGHRGYVSKSKGYRQGPL